MHIARRHLFLACLCSLAGCANPVYNPANIAPERLAIVSAHGVLLPNTFSRPDTNIVMVKHEGDVIVNAKGMVIPSVRLPAGRYWMQVRCQTSWGYAFPSLMLTVAEATKYEVSCDYVSPWSGSRVATLTLKIVP